MHLRMPQLPLVSPGSNFHREIDTMENSNLMEKTELVSEGRAARVLKTHIDCKITKLSKKVAKCAYNFEMYFNYLLRVSGLASIRPCYTGRLCVQCLFLTFSQVSQEG